MNDDLEIDRPGRIRRDDSVRDVMTPLPRAIDTSASVMDAAEIMRDANIGDVVVLESGRLYGSSPTETSWSASLRRETTPRRYPLARSVAVS